MKYIHIHTFEYIPTNNMSNNNFRASSKATNILIQHPLFHIWFDIYSRTPISKSTAITNSYYLIWFPNPALTIPRLKIFKNQYQMYPGTEGFFVYLLVGPVRHIFKLLNPNQRKMVAAIYGIWISLLISVCSYCSYFCYAASEDYWWPES